MYSFSLNMVSEPKEFENTKVRDYLIETAFTLLLHHKVPQRF